MRYHATSRTVIYRSKMPRVLTRNVEIFPVLDWIAAVTAHIPNKGEHLLRYYGWVSRVNCGKRKKAEESAQPGSLAGTVEIPPAPGSSIFTDPHPPGVVATAPPSPRLRRASRSCSARRCGRVASAVRQGLCSRERTRKGRSRPKKHMVESKGPSDPLPARHPAAVSVCSLTEPRERANQRHLSGSLRVLGLRTPKEKPWLERLYLPSLKRGSNANRSFCKANLRRSRDKTIERPTIPPPRSPNRLLSHLEAPWNTSIPITSTPMSYTDPIRVEDWENQIGKCGQPLRASTHQDEPK